MKNVFINKMREFNMELNRRGITCEEPDIPDGYNQHTELEGIYDWGFTVVTYCDVLDPIITFYDWEYQSIVAFDLDNETKYQLRNGYLSVTEENMFSKDKHRFFINLNDGARVHESDIKCIGYIPHPSDNTDRRFYALNDGRIYFKADGEHLRQLLNVTIDDLLIQGFKIIEPEHYGANIDILNDMIVRM